MASIVPSPSSTVYPSPSSSPSPSVKGFSSKAGVASPTLRTPLETLAAFPGVALQVIFDTAVLAGFPALEASESVWRLQSRSGAGSSLLGYLNEAGDDAEGVVSVVLGEETVNLFLPVLRSIKAGGKRVVITVLPSTSSSSTGGLQFLSLVPTSTFTATVSTNAASILTNGAAIASAAGHSIHFVTSLTSANEISSSVAAASAAPAFEYIAGGSTPSGLPVVVENSLLKANSKAHIKINSFTNSVDLASVIPKGSEDLIVIEPEIYGLVSTLFNGIATSSTSKGSVKFITSPAEIEYFTTLSTPPPSAKKAVFFTPVGEVAIKQQIAATFLPSKNLFTRLSTRTSTIPVEVNSTVLSLSSAKAADETPLFDGANDLVYVSAAELVKSTSDAFKSLKTGGNIILHNVSVELLTAFDKAVLAEKNARVFALESNKVGAGLVAFLILYFGLPVGSPIAEKFMPLLKAVVGDDIVRDVESKFHEVTVETETVEGEDKRSEGLEFDVIPAWGSVKETAVSHADNVSGWEVAAQHFIFSEAFASSPETSTTISTLAPSVPVKTYLATVSELRRLTPKSYDRNVFHLSLSTKGTGLTYAVGEALGVHGWNDAAEVTDFLNWYGASPDTLLTIPLANGSAETRTAQQFFEQNIDVFGRPGKQFYAFLSTVATSIDDAKALRFISDAAGSSTFKKMAEVEFVTFVDVLKRFPSARPNLVDLAEQVGEIKERHYSISSAQVVVGEQVDLLVVTVDWKKDDGSIRYGQCTRYLAGLVPGQNVTVSIKPSVMKLPSSSLQPIIMAGLGTGAAPFRAFIQHRAWEKAQGKAIGPMYYYFGARYRAMEYLYGEELEAYVADGIITKIGLAFSRDGKAKNYIQHLMLKDGEVLSEMLDGEEKGCFYLCGPTWPVPDVFEAIVGSLMKGKNSYERKVAEGRVEEWKEEERYVLEVY